MKTVPIHDAKTNLSKYIAAAKRGEVIAIGAYGKEEVWLTSQQPKSTKQIHTKLELNTLRGKVWVAPDAFSEELDREISESFEANQELPNVDTI